MPPACGRCLALWRLTGVAACRRCVAKRNLMLLVLVHVCTCARVHVCLCVVLRGVLREHCDQRAVSSVQCLMSSVCVFEWQKA